MPEALGNTADFGRPAEIYYPGSTEEREYVAPEQREDDMGETSIHVQLVHRFLQMLLNFSRAAKYPRPDSDWILSEPEITFDSSIPKKVSFS